MDTPTACAESAVRTVKEFNAALNARDIDGMMDRMTSDTVFENTYPPPDGERLVGKTAVRLFWEQFFRGSASAHIETEEIFSAGDRVVMRWIYRWTDSQNNSGYIRGVDLYRLEGELIAEKLSYVKG